MKSLKGAILIFLIPVLGLSQSTNVSTLLYPLQKKGDHFFNLFAYRLALENYLAANEKNKDNAYVKERIADCYTKLNDPASAEQWLEELVGDQSVRSEVKFKYAEVLLRNGRNDQSISWFQEYLKDKPNDSLARRKVEFLNQMTEDPHKETRFRVSPVYNVNTKHSEYGANYYQKGIVFASSRDTDFLIRHEPVDGIYADESLLNVFYAVPGMNGEGTKPEPFYKSRLKTIFHEGPIAFYDNDTRCAFTQSNMKKGRGVRGNSGNVALQIYFADVSPTGELRNIVPFSFNDPQYSNAHPAFSPDGKFMFFTSTRESGYGGSDIYYSELVGNAWSYPVNIGYEVNTRLDESFPFMTNDSTLYFTSNGHGTWGGLDIFVSYKRNGKFTKPVNIGFPINTRFDDFSMIVDSSGRAGYFASNRPSGDGLDDIYNFQTLYYTVTGTVRELMTTSPVISNARITVWDEGDKIVDTLSTDASGSFQLKLPFDRNFTLESSKYGYKTPDKFSLTTKGKPLGFDSVELFLSRHKLFAKGKIYNEGTQTPLEDAIVVLKNTSDYRVDSIVTGKDAGYSFALIPNKVYQLEVTKKGFIANGFKLNTRNLSEGDLLNDVVLEETYLEKELVLFEYNDSKLTENSRNQLGALLKRMKQYEQKVKVYIWAHADSRGSAEYNLELSNKRANSISEYLIKNGVARENINAVGFGEELVLNKCSDGVDCPDEDHALSRRVEIKVEKVN
jgi:outer membrane protein OmpA-like peptidoglycan-associated protein/tetratricopeptide (TPR) repeat protein